MYPIHPGPPPEKIFEPVNISIKHQTLGGMTVLGRVKRNDFPKEIEIISWQGLAKIDKHPVSKKT